MIHFVGMVVQHDSLVRQRCAWCGAMLQDWDLERVMVPVEQQLCELPSWPVGGLVEMEGNAAWVVEHVPGTPLPPGNCAELDPAVTA